MRRMTDREIVLYWAEMSGRQMFNLSGFEVCMASLKPKSWERIRVNTCTNWREIITRNVDGGYCVTLSIICSSFTSV